MFQKSKSQKVSPKHTEAPYRLVLPQNFAEDVLNQEMALSIQCSIPQVSRLMELYSAAIEYYESIPDLKYLHYQERLQKLLTRRDVLKLLNDQPHRSSKLSESAPISIRKPPEKLKLKIKPVIPYEEIAPTQPVIVRGAEEVITTHNKETNITSNKVRDNIRVQEGKELKERLEARKRSNSSQPIQRKNSYKNGKKPDMENQMEKYQEEIEKIIEKYLEKKIVKIQEIKEKYKEQMNEIKAMGDNDTIKEILREMDKQMLREIEEITQQLAQERKNEIAELKGKNIFEL
ncbi:unnamed protein product [Blepharisma stoltei]|uniref:Uncharacterized protein n=1 Tax=Blepharisma stoltei TaxID=1481888 RepID=A0AAU9IJ88_9CILI|nr:unnamed protein product [Blepharisma stoltei]